MFKVGDRVVMYKNHSNIRSVHHRGLVTKVSTVYDNFLGYVVQFDKSELNDDEDNLVWEEELILEEVYDSSLYQALREKE